MSNIQIRTNNVPRDVIYGFELEPRYREEWKDLGDLDERQFVIFKHYAYLLDEFSRIISPKSERRHPMDCGMVKRCSYISG